MGGPYISPVKTWIAGEVLTASDLNTEILNTLASQIPEPAGSVHGDILFMGTNSWERLAAGTSNDFLQTKGYGSNPVWATAMINPMTTLGDIIYGGASGAITRLATSTAGMALTCAGAAAPVWAGMTTQGDIEYHNGTTRTRLAAGTSGQYLKTQGAGANPVWATMTSHEIKFLASPTNKISWTAVTDWTDVDISSDTGSDTAKAAILAVELSFLSGMGATKMTALFRKNGSSETSILPRIKAGAQSAGEGDNAFAAGMIIVELDGSEVFETKLQTDAGSPSSISFKVDLIGYFT